MLDGDELIVKVTVGWEKGFNCGVIIPLEIKICSECTTDSLRKNCDKIVNQAKVFS